MRDRNAMFAGKGNCVRSRERRLAKRRTAGQRRVESPHRQLDAHLIVPLAGAAVRHDVGAIPAGVLDQKRGDQWAGERRRERIAVFVECIGSQRHQSILHDEALPRVDQHGVVGAQRERLCAYGIQRGLRAGSGNRIAFTQVDRHRDDVVPFKDELL